MRLMRIQSSWHRTSAYLLLAGAASVAVPSAPALGQAGRTAAADARRAERMRHLDAEHFYTTAQIVDDELSTVAEINTRKGFTWRGGFTDRVRSDSYLRALVAKGDGRTVVQVYQTITYSGPNRHFESATYYTPKGPASARVARLGSDVPSCTGSLCVWEDQIAFAVPEDVLRRITIEAEARTWRFRFLGSSGEHWDDDLPRAEIAGLLRRLDEYHARGR